MLVHSLRQKCLSYGAQIYCFLRDYGARSVAPAVVGVTLEPISYFASFVFLWPMHPIYLVVVFDLAYRIHRSPHTDSALVMCNAFSFARRIAFSADVGPGQIPRGTVGKRLQLARGGLATSRDSC